MTEIDMTQISQWLEKIHQDIGLPLECRGEHTFRSSRHADLAYIDGLPELLNYLWDVKDRKEYQ